MGSQPARMRASQSLTSFISRSSDTSESCVQVSNLMTCNNLLNWNTALKAGYLTMNYPNAPSNDEVRCSSRMLSFYHFFTWNPVNHVWCWPAFKPSYLYDFLLSVPLDVGLHRNIRGTAPASLITPVWKSINLTRSSCERPTGCSIFLPWRQIGFDDR